MINLGIAVRDIGNNAYQLRNGFFIPSRGKAFAWRNLFVVIVQIRYEAP